MSEMAMPTARAIRSDKCRDPASLLPNTLRAWSLSRLYIGASIPIAFANAAASAQK